MRRGSEESPTEGERKADSSFFRVVLGSADTTMDACLAALISELMDDSGDEREREFISSSSIEEMDGLACCRPVDLFVLVLNNLREGSLTVLDRMRALKEKHRTHILGLAGSYPPPHSASSFRVAALEAGADAFLPLPPSIDEFRDHVCRLLGFKPAPRIAPRAAVGTVHRVEPSVRSGHLEYPAEGYSLRWDGRGLQVRATDHHAGTLRLRWEDLMALAKIARGERS
jgi:DNA-binding response OmpR family regulator